MRKVKILLAVFLIGVVFGMVACGAAGPALEDTIWVMESYGEQGELQAVLADTEITAEFRSADGTVAGSSGCNSYSGGYEINEDNLTVKPPIISTMMACLEPVMEQEQKYFSLLESAETFQIQNGNLSISSSGNQVMVFTAQ